MLTPASWEIFTDHRYMLWQRFECVFFCVLFSIELKRTEIPDVATEKERISAEIEKLNRERVDAALKMQTEVKVWWN